MAIAKKGVKSICMITQLAAAHFVSKDILGNLFMYGEYPRTALYNVSSDRGGIRLTPIM